MKRLFNVVAVIAITLFIPMVMSTSSSAQDCEISNTGPDSNNSCEVEDTYTCTVGDNNSVTITNSDDQVVGSGNVEVDNNGNGGGAVSGSTDNSSDTNFNVVIENNETCVATAVKPTPPVEPETPETPVQPGKGAQPAALPVTSGSNAPIALLSLGGIAAVVAVAVAYRRQQA